MTKPHHQATPPKKVVIAGALWALLSTPFFSLVYYIAHGEWLLAYPKAVENGGHIVGAPSAGIPLAPIFAFMGWIFFMLSWNTLRDWPRTRFLVTLGAMWLEYALCKNIQTYWGRIV